ncbi:MAG: silent information regulator protein Sir2, partial [Propionibacteriales bacterium]|nr:silent information regulator protein Sir2 [Propionibacteriales bacterium]
MQRRTMLGASASAVVGGTVLSSGLGPGAGVSPAYAEPGNDHDRIKANVIAQFAGTPATNADPATAGKRDKIIATARTRIKELDASGTDEVFAGVPLGSSDKNLTTTFTGLTEIALATRMPGAPADLLDNADVQLRVLDAFALVHQKYYGDQGAGYFGNWFNWEIGQPTQITRAFVLLEDPLNQYRPGLLATFVATMDAYLRAGKDGDVDLESRFHTGANLADITTNRIIQGALLGDDQRVAKAVSDQLTVYATVDPDNLVNDVSDGYYADGSFIQHDSVAYTGSYGKILLQRSLQTIKILDQTGWSQADKLVPVVHGWVARGFAPVIFEGWMMEIVKGRGVSRTTTGYVDALAVVEAAVDLASYESGDQAGAMGGYAKYLTEISRAKVDPGAFVSPGSIVAYAALLADDSVSAANLTPAVSTYAYNAMARNVHHRPGWTFALARSSSRISKYEYMGGENLRPWFSGDGAH